VSTEPHMSITERRKYLMIQQKRYEKASRQERGHLLDEMRAVTGLNRKYLIQLLGTDLGRHPRQRQRHRSYGQEVEAALLVVAESLDFICGRRLKPALLSTAQDLQRHGELILTPEVEADLARISVSTIDRLLQRHKDRLPGRLPRRGPTRSAHILAAVPMRRIPWDEQEPGHLEVDLVHHSGPDTTGDYVHTLQMIDVATGWSERYAILGRSALVMHDAFRVLHHRLPFPIRQIHSDNGSEFLNGHMLRFWPHLDPQILFSRNHPWHNNDSRFVEQKNYTLVRAYLGYRRFDTVAQTHAINHLYHLMGLYYNLFQPVMRVVEKTWSPDDQQTPRLKRRYDQPQTPFQRLCATGTLDQDLQEAILQLRQALNPRQLRRDILALIEEIKALPNSAPNEQPDVFQTLSSYRPYTERRMGHTVRFTFDETIASDPVRLLTPG
jgi:hypothetical protein